MVDFISYLQINKFFSGDSFDVDLDSKRILVLSIHAMFVLVLRTFKKVVMNQQSAPIK